MRTTRRISAAGSIVSATGWPGAQNDETPSAVQASTPGAKLQTTGESPRFALTEGGTMPILSKSFDLASLQFAPTLDLEVKGSPDGRIEGYASTFGGKPDRAGDIIAPGAFSRTLAEHKAESTMPAMLWSHRIDEPIGRWTDLREDQAGLFVVGEVNLKTARGREAFAHVAAGDAGSFSIGYMIAKNGRKDNGNGSSTLTDLDLVEVSVVTVPANPRARITSVKSITSKAELFDLLREAGLAKAAAAKVASAGWPALAGDNSQKAIDLAAEIARATANLKGM